MKIKLLNRLSLKQRKLIGIISRPAEEKGLSAYLVGGTVRDILLHKANLDLDIVVESSGIEFAQQLAVRIKPLKAVYHKKFGTATLYLSDHSRLDVATSRKEIYAFPGALPEVVPGTIRDDLLRRDFSVNALAIRLNYRYFGELVDFSRGFQDLRKKKIRVMHDLSFIEDPTRILRAIRFKERFGFALEQHTGKILKAALKKKVFSSIKGPRLFTEVKKLLSEPNPRKVILSVGRLCKWDFVHWKIKLDSGKVRLLTAVSKQIDWFEDRFSTRRKLDTWLIYFMVLVNRLSRKEIKGLAERFNLKLGERKRLESIYDIETKRAKILAKKTLSASEVYRILQPLSYEAIIFLKAKNRSLRVDRMITDFLKVHNQMKISISGEDLKGLGVGQGKSIGKTLLKVLHAKIDGELNSRKEEFSFAQRILRGS